MELLSLNKSYFELQRLRYRPEALTFLDTIRSFHILPTINPSHISPETTEQLKKVLPFLSSIPTVTLVKGENTPSEPLRIGVLLSGGQAPGGHNVVIGLFEALKVFNKKTKVFGFIKGPLGLIQGIYKELDIATIYNYYNTGGFDMLSSSREKIHTESQKSSILKTVKKLKLDGLLIIGGDNSNTDTAMLAEYFLSHNCKTVVIGVPKTIDGDLKNRWIETSLGFHTSCSTYSEMIGNLAKDTLSIRKYHHFIRLMGQTASYTTLECSLRTLPNISLISESLAEKGLTLKEISFKIAETLWKRSLENKNYSIILIPEGLIQHLKDTKSLLTEINSLIAQGHIYPEAIINHLSHPSKKTFFTLPEDIRSQLLLARDSYGNVRVSKIAMEELLSILVREELKNFPDSVPFQAVTHFFGYESRAGFPSNFDANYAVTLGIFSALFLVRGHTGYMVTVKGLAREYSKWEGGGVPLFSMMHMEERSNENVAVIKTDSVSTSSAAYLELSKTEDIRTTKDCYAFPGPLQFFGSEELCDQRPLTLLADQQC
ncbi:diphosphate--fructose-6-phosphate 1-phosphotransferase [Chlamydiifrater phoenicopteri]|uniref:diphosphate--fructose-6-phosphate 1-phosphotransferase n=1 Tax=Chlamydiifrater phoenicopteri TaxID=2681469 RepID=UPI001BD0A299|nr:diphosphate--fructose-6-phosphate 1-phosphotransferase [Chlamydiifrater phoenicopteri]